MVSSNWDRVSLGDVCRVEAGAGFPIVHQGLKDQEFPFFKVGDMNTAGNEKEMHVFQHSISEEIRKKLRATAFPAGTIVFPKIGAAIATNKKRMIVKPSCVDNNVMALIPSENLDSSFLFYLLLNKDLSDFANTGNPPSIRQSNVEEWAIPLPPLTEQKRIASLLARADRLRQLRRTAHDLGDALLQSVFLEMFGDPVRNEKGWEEQNLNELCRNITDGTHDTPERTETGVPFITSKNIRPYEIDLSVLEYVSEETHQEILKRTNPQYGDVIYTNIGVNLGNAAMNKLPFSFSLKNVALLQPNSEVLNSYYLEALLNNERFKENLIYLSSAGGAQKFITLEVLRTISIPYPPLSLQEEFAGVVARVESLRGRMGESERQVEGLFESLLAEAFS